MKLLVLDGNSIINRAFYGIKMLSTKSGIFTNGIYGFMNILNHLIELENPDGVVVAFDVKAKTFRHKKYEGYKAGRKGTPPELLSQMPLLKELLCYLGHTCIECEGYEADDIIGTIARLCEEQGAECVISTGDRDSLQLISDKTKVLLATTKMGRPEAVCMDKEELFLKYGLTPLQMIDLKALMGDASDKIPGVAGVGEKTALSLIKEFKSLDNLYANIESENIKESVRNKLKASKDMAYLSLYLGTICKEVPINTDLSSYLSKPKDINKLAALLRKLEFYKMLEKLGVESSTEAKKDEISFSKLKYDGKKVFVLKTEEGAAIAFSGGFNKISEEELTLLLEENSENICCHDSKSLYRFMMDKNITPKVFLFDTLLAGYLLSPSSSSYNIESLFSANFDINLNVDGDEQELLAVKGFLLTEKLNDELINLNQKELFYDIEMPLALVLAEMEQKGFLLNISGLKKEGEELSLKIKELEEQIFEQAGETFNINSPKQLGIILFEKLNLPAKKKTKSGYSTGAEILEALKDEHSIIPLILEYRTITKLKATYCDGLIKAAKADGVVHTTFNQTEARTGRISSVEPNLQNIPVKRPEGKKLRKYFIARENSVLLDADYSQIELRVLAAIAKDKAMLNAFSSKVDIHTLTAREVFNLPQNLVSPILRSRAKAVNFGIVYGIGAFSLAKDIGVSTKEAKELIEGYFKTYPEVTKYMEDVVQKAKENGFVTTIFGRRRYLPELSSSNGMLRAFGERVARNMPIQGTAADIIKIAMIKVRERLKKENIDAEIILQVHDELIVEAAIKDKDKAAKIMEEEMRNAADIGVELYCEVNSGKNWFEAKN